jgi:hypothetical protein
VTMWTRGLGREYMDDKLGIYTVTWYDQFKEREMGRIRYIQEAIA